MSTADSPQSESTPTLDAPKDLTFSLRHVARVLEGEYETTGCKHCMKAAVWLRSSLPSLLSAQEDAGRLREALEEIAERPSYSINPRDAFDEALSRANKALRASRSVSETRELVSNAYTLHEFVPDPGSSNGSCNVCGEQHRSVSETTTACKKVPHFDDGYLHDASDDGPYDVDGIEYCGRCHRALPHAPASETTTAETGK